jgi:hypothetical protein
MVAQAARYHIIPYGFLTIAKRFNVKSRLRSRKFKTCKSKKRAAAGVLAPPVCCQPGSPLFGYIRL